ncbi:MAG: hypothetical protein M0R80_17385 [Proteobacteria bacterium]|jgi:hypothetical protein|nr:hypothetical protein [Pseudomonadota bacterium]
MLESPVCAPLSLLPCALALAAGLLWSGAAAADACRDRCDESYQSCAAVEAAGCELGSDLAADAASELADQVVPGFGALFGGFTKQMTKEACEQNLLPCRQILTNCVAECPPEPGPAGPAPIVAPPPVPTATFRVFSDHPRTIVYINGARMGATPDDPLQPFVSPELRVGKYWVRLVTLDGRWEWEGAKDVEEGNLNSVEGTLVNLEEREWAAAQALDRQGNVSGALAAYQGFVARFSDSPRIAEAEARIPPLTAAMEEAERALYAKIEQEPALDARLTLCLAYLGAFEQGFRRAQVERIAADAEQEQARRAQEAADLAALTAAVRPVDRLRSGEAFLAAYPGSAHRPEAERIVAAAREEIADAQRVGKPLRAVGITALVVGLAAAAAGAGTGIGALVKDKQLEDDCQSNGDCGTSQHDDLDARNDLARSSDVLLIGGGVLAVAGIVLLAVAPDRETADVELAPVAGPNAVGARLTVRF